MNIRDRPRTQKLGKKTAPQNMPSAAILFPKTASSAECVGGIGLLSITFLSIPI